MQQWWETELMGNFMTSTYFPLREEKNIRNDDGPYSWHGFEGAQFPLYVYPQREDVCLCPKCLLAFAPFFRPVDGFILPLAPIYKGRRQMKLRAVFSFLHKKVVGELGVWQKKPNWAHLLPPLSCTRKMRIKMGGSLNSLFCRGRKINEVTAAPFFFYGTPEAHIKVVW